MALMQSKVTISPEYYQSLVNEYNRLFSKWEKAKGSKQTAIGLELERLNERIIEAERLMSKK